MDRELLIEIGCEEIPAGWLPGLTAQMAQHVDARLKEARLTSDAPAEAYSTPRRLTARVIRVAERQTDFEELVTGPPVSAAFKPDGEPTPAATGFAKKYGVEMSALERQQTPKGEYLAYRVRQRGKATVDVLADVMGGVLRDIDVPEADALGRLPRRRQGRPVFARPIRWLVLLYGGRVVPFVIRRTEQAQGPTVQDIRSGPEHLRPSLPDDQRPRRPRDQGQDLRRLSGAAARELRHPRPRASASRRSAASSKRTRAGSAVASAPSGGAVVAAAGGPRPRRVPRGRRRAHSGGVPPAPRGSADDDDDSSPALLSGGGRGGQAQAGVPRRDQHGGREAGDHRAQFRARADRAAARRAVLLGRGPQGDARVADRSALDDPVPQEAGHVSGEGGARRVAGGVDRRGGVRSAGSSGARRTGGPAVQGRSGHRHGARAHRAAGHDGRHLRARGRPARAGLEGDLLPLPADRRRGRRAADAAAARRGGGDRGRRCRSPTSSTRWSACSRPASGPPARAIRSASGGRRRAR